MYIYNHRHFHQNFGLSWYARGSSWHTRCTFRCTAQPSAAAIAGDRHWNSDPGNARPKNTLLSLCMCIKSNAWRCHYHLFDQNVVFLLCAGPKTHVEEKRRKKKTAAAASDNEKKKCAWPSPIPHAADTARPHSFTKALGMAISATAPQHHTFTYDSSLDATYTSNAHARCTYVHVFRMILLLYDENHPRSLTICPKNYFSACGNSVEIHVPTISFQPYISECIQYFFFVVPFRLLLFI